MGWLVCRSGGIPTSVDSCQKPQEPHLLGSTRLPSFGSGSHPGAALQPSELDKVRGSSSIFFCPLSLEADGALGMRRQLAAHCIPGDLHPFVQEGPQPRLRPRGALRASIQGVYAPALSMPARKCCGLEPQTNPQLAPALAIMCL